jgi:hypothetical protein
MSIYLHDAADITSNSLPIGTSKSPFIIILSAFKTTLDETGIIIELDEHDVGIIFIFLA